MLSRTIITLILLLNMCSTGIAKTIEHQEYINGFINWLHTNSDPVTGLPFSHVGDEQFRNWTMTYDSAIVTIAYIASDNINDAEKIINFYIETPLVWRLGGIIEAVNTQTEYLGEDWSVRAGANLWLGIASFHLYKKTNEKKYLDLSQKIANFAISLQNKDKNNVNFGGVRLGPLGGPNVASDQHIGYDVDNPSFYDIYSTEVSIDAYTLFRMLFIETKDIRYNEAYKATLSWLRVNGYNKQSHRFNRGFIDEMIATDVQSWGLSALGVDILETFEKDAAEKIVEFIENHCISKVSYQKYDGELVNVVGTDFIDKNRAKELKRQPLVSPEWTFQLINAYQRLSSDFNKKDAHKKSVKYKNRKKELIDNMLILATNINNQLAYPYATKAEAIIGHEYLTPKKGNLSAIGTAYAILALIEYDPLNIEQLFNK